MWVKTRTPDNTVTYGNLDLSQMRLVSVYQRADTKWSVVVDSSLFFDKAHATKAEAEAEMFTLIRPDGIRWFRGEDGDYRSLTNAIGINLHNDGVAWRLRVDAPQPSGSTIGATVYASEAEANAARADLIANLGEWIYP